MSSNLFTVTYADGKQYTEICDAQTIEDFKNRHFGSIDPDEYGIDVNMEPYGEEGPTEPAPPAEPVKTDPPSDEETEETS